MTSESRHKSYPPCLFWETQDLLSSIFFVQSQARWAVSGQLWAGRHIAWVPRGLVLWGEYLWWAALPACAPRLSVGLCPWLFASKCSAPWCQLWDFRCTWKSALPSAAGAGDNSESFWCLQQLPASEKSSLLSEPAATLFCWSPVTRHGRNSLLSWPSWMPIWIN